MSAFAADRRAMLAKIHVGRKQLFRDDEAYRDMLERITGHRTSATCSVPELSAVLSELYRLGFKPQPGARPISDKSWVRVIFAIWRDIRPLLDDAGDEALRGFVRRQTHSAKNPDGIGDPEWLDPAEAKKVIHGLEGWRATLLAEKRETAGV